MGRSQPVAGQQLWHQPPELAWMLSAACLADPSLAAGSSPSADAAKNISERLPVMQLHLLSICSASGNSVSTPDKYGQAKQTNHKSRLGHDSTYISRQDEVLL